MNSNFPNHEPVVAEGSEMRVLRRLPANADIKIRPRERVTASQVLAKVDPRTTAMRFTISEQLGVAPQDAAKHLMKPIGSTFAAGEAMARVRKGLRNTIVAAPIAGTLLALDSDTGVALISRGDGTDIRALVAGDVEFIEAKQTVCVRSVGSRAFGIVGIGGDASGPIVVVAQSPADLVDGSRLVPDMAGTIVVAGPYLTAATIKRMIEVGIVGVICGGIVEREIVLAVGGPPEDRLVPWRIGPGDDGIGQELRPGLAIMATEGFGALPMHDEIYAFLRRVHGQPAALLTQTRTTGHLARPMLVIADDAGLEDDANAATLQLSPQTPVRLVDPASLGRTGKVAGPVRAIRRADGHLIDVIDIAFSDASVKTLPAANVEIIA